MLSVNAACVLSKQQRMSSPTRILNAQNELGVKRENVANALLRFIVDEELVVLKRRADARLLERSLRHEHRVVRGRGGGGGFALLGGGSGSGRVKRVRVRVGPANGMYVSIFIRILELRA
jgi:hypothetical protein